MTRMTSQAESQRAEIEDVLAALGRARVLIRAQVRLRVAQAAQREAVSELLTPVLGQLDDVERAVLEAQALLGEYWTARTAEGWRVTLAHADNEQ